jgi:hypothetical protein
VSAVVIRIHSSKRLSVRRVLGPDLKFFVNPTVAPSDNRHCQIKTVILYEVLFVLCTERHNVGY